MERKIHYLNPDEDDLVILNGTAYKVKNEKLTELSKKELSNNIPHKLSFKDGGLHLDDKRICGIVDYEVKGNIDDFTTLKLELIVDDEKMFDKELYEFN